MTDSFDKRAPIGRTADTRTSISHLLGMGMGMGTHVSEGPHPYRSPAHMVYGDALIDRHEWRHTVFLVEFLMTTDWQTEITIAPHYGDDSSPETKAELKKLRDKQDHDGRRERHDEIIAEADDYLGLFENLCYFDAHSHPVTFDLVQIVDQIGWTVVQYYKERYGRTRPSYLDPAIRPIVRVPTHSSFPSGHSTQAHLIKHALSEVFSFRSDDFRHELSQVAIRIAENREWAGVHFESDTIAGQNLALSIWDLVKLNSNFDKLIGAARAEAKRLSESGYRLLDHSNK